MLSMLNQIKEVIQSSIKVEVKNPVTRNGKAKYPVIVTDMSSSFTSGWFVQYNPVAQDNGTRLYDGAESFSELHIARFSELHNLILTANYYFLQGHGVETLSDNRKRAIYEPNGKVRLTVTSQQNSVSVVATITDEQSPFHMMSVPFTVVASNTGDGSYYVVGTDKYWDRNTDMFQEFNANLAPRKARFYRVYQQQNQPATLRAKIAVVNNQYQIYPDGSFAIDANAAAPEYIQVITSEYKALAYIYEQTLMNVAFEMALAQGLPAVSASPVQTGNFVPAFTLPNVGTPNPVPAAATPTPVQTPDQTPVATQPPFHTGEISADELPWPMS